MKLLVFIISLIILTKLVVKKEKFTNKYKPDRIIYHYKNTEIYTVLNNDKLIYKKYKQTSPYNIEKEVGILKSTVLSPEVLDYGDDYIVLEKLDRNLKEILLTKQVDRKMLRGFLIFNKKLDNFKYEHLDKHMENVFWDDKGEEFKIIDWEKTKPQKPKVNRLSDKKYLLLKANEYCKDIPLVSKRMLFFYLEQFIN
jgi:predicted Ser/Thr protein kinase